MKTSELIDKLSKIAKTVPFDADVVTGDDWLPQQVTNIYHNPPHTYIEFESYAEDEWGDEKNNSRVASITELATRAHMIEQILEMIEANPNHSKEDIIDELGGLSVRMHSMIKALQK